MKYKQFDFTEEHTDLCQQMWINWAPVNAQGKERQLKSVNILDVPQSKSFAVIGPCKAAAIVYGQHM